jgi:hypothetical protein
MRAQFGIAILALGLATLSPHALAARGPQGDPWNDDEDWASKCDQDPAGDQRVKLCETRVVRMRAPHGAIRVDGGENGGVSFRGWEADSVIVHARIQVNAKSRDEGQELAKRIRIVTDGATIRAEGPPSTRGAGWAVSFYLAVPRHSDLSAETTNGPVAAEHVEGRMDFRTLNGPVELREVGGDVRARAVNGPLEIELTGKRWSGEGLDAETTNGPVDLSVPAGYGARLETGTTNGPVDIGIPITIDVPSRAGHRDRRRIITDLGSGGPPVRVVTRNGPVSIRQAGADMD